MFHKAVMLRFFEKDNPTQEIDRIVLESRVDDIFIPRKGDSLDLNGIWKVKNVCYSPMLREYGDECAMFDITVEKEI